MLTPTAELTITRSACGRFYGDLILRTRMREDVNEESENSSSSKEGRRIVNDILTNVRSTACDPWVYNTGQTEYLLRVPLRIPHWQCLCRVFASCADTPLNPDF